MDILIVGGVKKAKYLIKNFKEKNNKVTYINKDIQFCKSIDREFGIDVICGDATNPKVLSDVNADLFDVCITLCPTDADNLVICRIAKLYGVKRTISVVNNQSNTKIFNAVGVDTTVSVAGFISMIIEKNAYRTKIEELISIDEGKALILEVEVKSGFRLIGKCLNEINLPEECSICCIIRKENAVIPRGHTAILEGDKLIIMTLPQARDKVMKAVNITE